VLARDLYFSGNTVIIDHGCGLFTFYCHFSLLKVKRGDMVGKGDVVALAGGTGRSTGPHLHWGARIMQSRVDPVALLSLPLPE
ncbi:MAG: M23 family metallopeptidase, partial [Acidobacteriota bacterium]